MRKTLIGMMTALAMGAVMGEADAVNIWKVTPEMFPFTISYDAKVNAANVSYLIEAPAGKHGFVRVEGDHFATDAGPIRFHATNLTGPANFPSHADADRLAERLARLGINCVRHHFMDTWYSNFMPRTQGILADDTLTQRKLDPAQLDKFDYLIAALKKRGIYSNLNLHVGRTLDSRDGCPNGSPWANKCVGQYMPRMIELQKEYAGDLLSHVNPYTGKALKDEPSIAMIEVSNEDSIYGLRNGPKFGSAFRDELTRQWNVWLKKNYASSAAIAKAWCGELKLESLGAELIAEGEFSNAGKLPKPAWRTELGSAKATFAIKDGVLRAQVTQPGDKWDPKIFRKLKLEKGRTYTLSFRVRQTKGAKQGELSCAMVSLAKGWRAVGLQTLVPLTKEWKECCHVFSATEGADTAQLQLRFPVGTVEIDELSLKPGASEEALKRATQVTGFEEGKVAAYVSGDLATKRRDWLRFLMDTEAAYWTGIHRHVRDVVGAKQPVSGTQLQYSPQVVQGQLDYIDTHNYWRHPSGGSPAAWIHAGSKARWAVGGDAMVNSLNNVFNLSQQRVRTLPYTVSEYNNPPPNPYGAEGQPIMVAVAAYQNWSGVFQYSYNHYPNEYAPKGNPWCIFDSIARTEVLAHYPACAAMLLRGDVKPATAGAYLPATVESTLDKQMGGGISVGYSPFTNALTRAIGVDITAKPVTERGQLSPSPFVWNRDVPGKAYFTVDTENTKLFTGFPEGRSVRLGGVELKIGKTSLDWATVSLLSRQATGFGEKGSASILVAATAASGNADQEVIRVGANGLALKEHGTGPVVAEGVPFTLTLPAAASRVTCWALAPDGERREKVAVKAIGEKSQLALGPQYRTVWYEVEVK